jgi:hypothetical protein
MNKPTKSELLGKNPTVVEVFEENERKVLATGGATTRRPKGYSLALPYGERNLAVDDSPETRGERPTSSYQRA